MTPAGIEPATFVAQRLNHCVTAHARLVRY